MPLFHARNMVFTPTGDTVLARASQDCLTTRHVTQPSWRPGALTSSRTTAVRARERKPWHWGTLATLLGVAPCSSYICSFYERCGRQHALTQPRHIIIWLSRFHDHAAPRGGVPRRSIGLFALQLDAAGACVPHNIRTCTSDTTATYAVFCP